MRLRALRAALLLGALSGLADAQGIKRLDATVVTATRTARTVDETLASVTVITRAEIERRQAQSVQDLLRGVPGLSIANNGGPGKVTSVFLRGTESDHVLVLIDGVKVGSATTGTAAFQDIPVELIERIEIVRGPRSSLYGSEAIGGVIQIFTRKGAGPVRPTFSIGAGRYGTYTASAGVSGSGERGWVTAHATGLTTQGFNACDGRPAPGGAGCFTFEPDRDGYRNLAGSLRAGYRFENGAEAEMHALRSGGKNKFDGTTVNEGKTVQQVLGGRLRVAPITGWQLTLAAGASRDESDNFKDGRFMTSFDTRRDSASLQSDIAIGAKGLLTAGLDYQVDEISSTTVFTRTSRDNKGAFAQYQASFQAHGLQLALRHDSNEQFGQYTTGGAAWGYTLTPKLRLFAAYGTAFKAPTFNELFFPGFGNPNLGPEKSRSLELGIIGTSGPARWSVNAYETRIDNLIAFNAATFAPDNIEQARIRGLEAVLAVTVGGWDVNTNLTLLDPENRSAGANNGTVLPRRAEQAVRLDLDRAFGRRRAGASVHAEGRRYDDLANTRRLGSYATVDLRAEYAPARSWLLQARLANLFDKEYETAAFFNQPRRSLFLTLRYQP